MEFRRGIKHGLQTGKMCSDEEFQHPKMEVITLVPYFWPYFVGIFS